jgi:hypothetical protein
VSAIFIAFIALLLIVSRLIFGKPEPEEFYYEFASNIVNALSILWLLLVLIYHRKSNDATLGVSIKLEMSTIALLVITTGVYSALRIFKML